MDNINKIYKSKQLRRYVSLTDFLEEANNNHYEIVAVTESEGYYTVVYKDHERS